MTDFATALNRLWPSGDSKIKGLRAGIVASAPEVFAKRGIDSTLVLTHLMAQISHECGGGIFVVENMNYTAQRMMQVWPTRFPTLASAQPYAGNPRALANKTYNGRMGNRPGTDDGYNFRGRGGSQTTGREGYERVQKATGLPVVENPDLLLDPRHFLDCAVSDFINCGCLPYAKANDIVMVTKRLNGGQVGIADRRAWFAKWDALKVTVPRASGVPAAPAANPGPAPVKPVAPADQKPPKPSVATPASGSLGAWLAGVFSRLFKKG